MRICEYCGKEFVPYQYSSHKYCSEECRTKVKYNKMPLLSKKCLHCGLAFETSKPRQVYCSPQCRKRNKSLIYKNRKRFDGNRLKVLERDGYKCTECGSAQDLGVHHKDGSGNSERPNNALSNLVTLCNSCHANEHKHEIRHRPRINKPVTTTCLFCGKEFQTDEGRVQDGRGKYCSKVCFNKSMIKLAEFTCQHCGKIFTVWPSRLKRGKTKFCSMSCRRAAGYAWTAKAK